MLKTVAVLDFEREKLWKTLGLQRISELREYLKTPIEFFKFQKVSKQPIFEKKNRVLPMVFGQKIDILQIPPTGVDFL